jgi:hypothetical protein
MSQRATASLIVLMASARELSNPELAELSGFVLDGADRRHLNELGLVSSRRVGRAYAHVLTQEGWRAARGLLGAGRPAKAGSFGGALYALLAGVGAGLDRVGLSPAEFFGASPVREGGHRPELEGTQEAEQAQAEAGAEAVAPVEAGARAVETAIRAAYADLADRAGGWVGLAPLRTRLATYDRAEVDRALRSLAVQPDVLIVPVANLKSLTSADREAALRLGGEDNHAIAIEAR